VTKRVYHDVRVYFLGLIPVAKFYGVADGQERLWVKPWCRGFVRFKKMNPVEVEYAPIGGDGE
jgi:hypothetical protein